MKSIASARIAMLDRARAMLSLHRRGDESAPAHALLSNDTQTLLGDTGIVLTPAQDLAFFARSTAWRCTTCGKVHSFDERVSVALASPCACSSIEFEPQHETGFPVTAPLELLLAGMPAG